MKGLIFLVVAAALVVIAAVAGGPILERNRRAGEMQELRSALDQSRMSADSCKLALAMEQEDFLQFDRTVDSLRTEMESYEDPEQGGVPQETYTEYLRSFEDYNESVEDWQALADTLQARDARCREIVEAHNALGDSIRRIQEAWREGNR
jgi:hypothetical protein